MKPGTYEPNPHDVQLKPEIVNKMEIHFEDFKLAWHKVPYITSRLSPKKHAVLRQFSWPVTKFYPKEFQAISENFEHLVELSQPILSCKGGRGTQQWLKNEKC